MFARRAGVVLLAWLSGCLGDPSLVPADETGTTDADETGDEESESDPTELLLDGSFEMWSGDSLPTWIYGNAMLEQTEDDVVDGESAARVVSMDRQSIGQVVPQSLAAGDCLEVELSLRWVDGEPTTSPVGLIESDGCEGDCRVPIPLQWATTGDWIDTEVTVMNADDRTEFRFVVSSEALVPQTFDIDAASLKIVPCE